MSTLSSLHPSIPAYDLKTAPAWFLQRAKRARSLALSLAPIRYARVAEPGGPIQKIEYGQGQFLGETWHLCRASLLPQWQHPMNQRLELFHPADGSGMGRNRLEARARAVSEALERWAYHETSAGPRAAEYAYPEHNSTQGMAAFPGIFPGNVRNLALAEAYESHAVSAWWLGYRDHWSIQRNEHSTTFIHEPAFAGYIAIGFRHFQAGPYRLAFGFGSGKSPQEAERRAHLEAARLELLLKERAEVPEKDRPKPVLPTEQRYLLFASADGVRQIMDRLSVSSWQAPRNPRVLYDGPVDGPWNRFTRVWRYALEPLCSPGNLSIFQV